MEQLASLQQRIADMINEKQGLTTLNAELQKKAVALIAKEKAMQGQTAAARTAAEVGVWFVLLYVVFAVVMLKCGNRKVYVNDIRLVSQCRSDHPPSVRFSVIYSLSLIIIIFQVASTVAENMEVAAEQNLEKERQYQDTLQLIVDERQKLNKQLKEFDQLALDLQTRLDDKELKANGIQNSFKQFKK